MNSFCSFIKKHREIVGYLVFGALTTVVSFAVYFSVYHYLSLSAGWSNVISWVCAVLFAFVTNKPFVFHSYDWSCSVVLPELGKFVGSRLLSGFLETAILAVTVDMLQLPNLWMKLLASVIVVILNYVFSKLIVFRSNKNESQ